LQLSARFRRGGAADVALASRLEDGLNFNQLGLVVLHVLDEGASGVVGAEDLLFDELLGEVMSEEGWKGGGGDVLGGESEDVSDLPARIELGRLGKLEGCVALDIFIGIGKWVSMDHSRSKKHEGDGVLLAGASKFLKNFELVNLSTSRTNSTRHRTHR